jgi:hypothetical protein
LLLSNFHFYFSAKNESAFVIEKIVPAILLLNIDKVYVLNILVLLASFFMTTLYAQEKWGIKMDTSCIESEKEYKKIYYAKGKDVLADFYDYHAKMGLKVNTVSVWEKDTVSICEREGFKRKGSFLSCDSPNYYLSYKTFNIALPPNYGYYAPYYSTFYDTSGKKVLLSLYTYFEKDYVFNTEIWYYENGNLKSIDSTSKEGSNMTEYFYSFYEDGTKKQTVLKSRSVPSRINEDSYNNYKEDRKYENIEDTTWSSNGKPINIIRFKQKPTSQLLLSSNKCDTYKYINGIWYTNFPLASWCGSDNKTYEKVKKTALYYSYKHNKMSKTSTKSVVVEGDFYFYSPEDYLLVEIHRSGRNTIAKYYNPDGSLQKVDKTVGRKTNYRPAIPTYYLSKEDWETIK